MPSLYPTTESAQVRITLISPAVVLRFPASFCISISFRISSQGPTVRCRYCGFRRKRGVFCPRCGFHIYEALLIDRRETIKLYLACGALYAVLIVYVSL